MVCSYYMLLVVLIDLLCLILKHTNSHFLLHIFPLHLRSLFCMCDGPLLFLVLFIYIHYHIYVHIHILNYYSQHNLK